MHDLSAVGSRQDADQALGSRSERCRDQQEVTGMDPSASAQRRPPTGVTWRERGLALGSLGCGLIFSVVLVAFGVRNLGYLALALAGLAITVGGLWWSVTEQTRRRGLGIAGVAIGLVLMALAIIGMTPNADRPLLRLLLLAILLGAALGLGRAALARDLHAHDDRQPVSVTAPAHPVLICNPWSGGGKVAEFGLADLAREFGVEVVMLDRGLDLEQLARDAIARGADCLGMAGGDGSQALVASIAIEHDLPFVCVAAGTGTISLWTSELTVTIPA